MSGFASGLSSLFDVGTQGHGGFVGRTVIMAVVGGTAAVIGGGKFANGAIAGAFMHMFNAEALTLRQSLSKLWKKITNGTVGRGVLRAAKGGLHGYRQVRDHSPWYARGMLKVGMTSVEIGATKWIKDPLLYVYTHVVSGAYLDTYTLSPVSYGTSQIINYSGYDNRWFK